MDEAPVSDDQTYALTPEDRTSLEEAAEWFLGTLKPRTAPEVRGVLVKQYLAGVTRGIRLTKAVLKEVVGELTT